MTRNPVTVTEETSIDDALHVMRERKVRRLPVLDHSGKMVGIVSDRDLLHAAPSPATSLSVYELHYLLAKLTIKRVMSSPVITVTSSTPLEEAARIMADNKIGGLPVTDDGRLVGIITETDIFKILLELLGARTPGVRVIVVVQEAKGVLAQITRVLADLGANIVSVATYGGPSAGEPRIMFKLSDVAPAAVRGAFDKLGLTVTDFRAV
jgi:acetoin utilization protein AcuB